MTQNFLLHSFSPLFHSSFIPTSPLNSLMSEANSIPGAQHPLMEGVGAMAQWRSGIIALETILLKNQTRNNLIKGGLILTSPAPILSHELLISHFYTGIFTPEACHYGTPSSFQLPASLNSQIPSVYPLLTELPLFPTDPLTQEQFALVFTPDFGLLMVLGYNAQGKPQFYFSFEPQLLNTSWQILRSRLIFTRHPQLPQLEQWVEQFNPPSPDYRLVTEFSRYLLEILPTTIPSIGQSVSDELEESSKREDNEALKTSESSEKAIDVELLQALTHEIRTPLTTIRTLTKLLLKRKDLNEKVLKHLEVIDQECTEQINRMELIFKAAEMKSQPTKQQRISLSAISLEQVFQQSIPRWKNQAQRRNVLLDVIVPKQLPYVISDPAMLDQILTGLMEKFTRSAPNGGHIKVQITTAGNQLKLQMLSQCGKPNNALKSLGNLLMFQPETGSLTLNIDVTKNLFQALGGKLIVRQKPDFGEVLTIFLPLMNIAEVRTQKSE